MMGLKRKPPADNSRRVHSNGQTLCGVVTNKAGRTVQFESFAERSLLLRLDRSADVQDYLSQPDPIPYRDPSGKSHH
jgi:TnsA-like endonuclease N terminal